MIDLPLPEQFDRLLWAAAVGLCLVPLWYLVARTCGRRGFWRSFLEFWLLGLLGVGAAAALFVGTLGDLRAYVPVGFAGGGALAAGLLHILRAPWQETRHRHRI